MGKLTLKANPTFKAKVGIPVAGAEPVDVEFVFRHRTRTELDEFIKARADQPDAEYVLQMASGWDLADEFSAENVALMLENYIGSALAIFRKYVDELVQSRLKN